MKFRAIIYSIFAVFTFMACNDDLSPVGIGILPEEDRLSVRIDTISFVSSTQIVDSIFSKTSLGLLGNFYDPTYGETQYGYLCNFYTSPSAVFGEVIDDRIDSVILILSYRSFIGDSLTAMEATVYGIPEGKKLDRNYYSNIDPWQYAKKDLLWAKKSYTARDLNVSDSIYFQTLLYPNSYSHYLKFDLPKSVGQQIYNKWNSPEKEKTFGNLDEFFKFFPGMYIESTYGSGNILVVEDTRLVVYYDTPVQLKDIHGNDSIIVERPEYALFCATDEVTQLNKFKNRERDNLQLINDNTLTYLKTPAGVVTQLEIDLQKIVEKIGDNRTFNNVRLILNVEEQKKEQYPLQIPPTVLLINPDSVKIFFEEGRRADRIYNYYAFLSESSTYKYDFGNISNLIERSIKQLQGKYSTQGEWPLLKLWVIPVAPISYDNGQNISGTINYFKPSGASLKTGEENLKLYITTSRKNN